MTVLMEQRYSRAWGNPRDAASSLNTPSCTHTCAHGHAHAHPPTEKGFGRVSGVRTSHSSICVFPTIFFLWFSKGDTTEVFLSVVKFLRSFLLRKHSWTPRAYLLHLLASSCKMILKNFRSYLRRRNPMEMVINCIMTTFLFCANGLPLTSIIPSCSPTPLLPQ